MSKIKKIPETQGADEIIDLYNSKKQPKTIKRDLGRLGKIFTKKINGSGYRTW